MKFYINEDNNGNKVNDRYEYTTIEGLPNQCELVEMIFDDKLQTTIFILSYVYFKETYSEDEFNNFKQKNKKL